MEPTVPLVTTATTTLDRVVVASDVPAPVDRPLRGRRIFAQLIAGAIVVIIAVGFAGVFAARRLAEAEAVSDAAKTTDLFANLLVQPEITDALLTGDAAALAEIDHVVRDHVMDNSAVVRVKLWDTSGRIVYSDESRLIGQTFEIGEEEEEVFSDPQVRAEVSDLDEPENLYERDSGQLLETYRPVWTPTGTPMLFEVYFRYDEVTDRSSQLWRGFAGITLSSLLLLVVLMLPIVWRLLDRVRRGQDQREALLQRAVDASDEERRRIAGTLHDGVVQDLAAASFAVSGAADRAGAAGQHQVADDVRAAAGTVRSAIGGLRTLLVDIYPAGLAAGGLSQALTDLAGGLRGRGIEVTLDLQVEDLQEHTERLVYRTAKECLTNTARHSAATAVSVRVASEGEDMVLEIIDNGVGFDAEKVLAAPEEGHFGLRVLGDVAREAGAELSVLTAPGAGTRWLLRIPR